MSPRVGLNSTTIREAATYIADTQGFEAVTLASLAQQLKVRPPSLYNHVDGLQGIRQLLSIHGLEQLEYTMSRAAIGRAGDEAVRAIGKAYVAFVRNHPGLYEATLHAPDPHHEKVQQISNDIVDLVIQVLQAYELSGNAAIHAARGLRSLLHGFASLEQKGGFGIPLDLNVSMEILINAFIAGIHTIKENSDSERSTTVTEDNK
ncbi:TetR-like C-terminal domain-containing protein [Paenibacillus sp. S-12]|uniref:TetR-like C-terminal domain-containing protein n=1 Tax=Paenibacillus sp. S-12 TaxID=3031371 RepID=UPI0025A221CD|nr:TetR-like C-terminal domain-containing protein [Paenibacillus sp. S-12]